jgi:hypothetical protein
MRPGVIGDRMPVGDDPFHHLRSCRHHLTDHEERCPDIVVAQDAQNSARPRPGPVIEGERNGLRRSICDRR